MDFPRKKQKLRSSGEFPPPALKFGCFQQERQTPPPLQTWLLKSAEDVRFIMPVELNFAISSLETLNLTNPPAPPFFFFVFVH